MAIMAGGTGTCCAATHTIVHLLESIKFRVVLVMMNACKQTVVCGTVLVRGFVHPEDVGFSCYLLRQQGSVVGLKLVVDMIQPVAFLIQGTWDDLRGVYVMFIVVVVVVVSG